MKNFIRWNLSILFVTFGSFTYSQTEFKSLNYLYSIQGEYTVAGQHNREPNTDPDKWTEWIYDVSGNYPGLWSGDFLFQQSNINNRWIMIYEAQEQWENGALISILNHSCPPTMNEYCGWDGGVLSSLSNTEWQDLITDGGILNTTWKQRLDKIAEYLQYLEDNGVEVLFRPFHEMNQGKFWWGGRPGPEGTVKLYQLTHDYLTKDKGLSNLIFVWNLQDFGTLETDVDDYYPGEDYYDILSMDMYWSDGKGYSTKKYNVLKDKAGPKPIAIGECQQLPTESVLADQPYWTFFMAWAELVQKDQSEMEIRELYGANRVVVRNEMPGWQESGITSENSNSETQCTVSVFPNPATDILNINLGEHHEALIKIHSVIGNKLYSQKVNQSSASINIAQWSISGLAIVTITTPEGVTSHIITIK